MNPFPIMARFPTKGPVGGRKKSHYYRRRQRIGRAVALAFREGADVLIAYLSEDDDATQTKRLVEEVGRKAVLVRGDIQHPLIVARS